MEGPGRGEGMMRVAARPARAEEILEKAGGGLLGW